MKFFNLSQHLFKSVSRILGSRENVYNKYCPAEKDSKIKGNINFSHFAKKSVKYRFWFECSLNETLSYLAPIIKTPYTESKICVSKIHRKLNSVDSNFTLLEMLDNFRLLILYKILLSLGFFGLFLNILDIMFIFCYLLKF